MIFVRKTVHRNLVVVFLLLLSLLVVPACSDELPSSALTEAGGELLAVDPVEQSLTIKTEDEGDLVVRYNDDTVVTGTEQSLVGLARSEGRRVTVHYLEVDGERIAEKVELKGTSVY